MMRGRLPRNCSLDRRMLSLAVLVILGAAPVASAQTAQDASPPSGAAANQKTFPAPVGAVIAPGDPDPDAITPPPRPAPPREVGTVSPHHRFTLAVGGGKLLSLPVPAATVFVADPTIADVQPPSASSVFVFGKKPGTTTLFALTHDGKPILAYNVVVEYDLGVMQQAINDAAPGSAVQLHRTPHGLVLQGAVPTPEASANLQNIAQRYAAPNEMVLNQLQVGGSTQVNLRVRVAEVSRSVSRELGFNWNTVFSNLGSFAVGLQTGFPTGALGSLTGLGGNATNVSSIFGSVASRHANGTVAIDAMADEGLVTLLAEPNLTTTSGEPASFLAGGEYPIPVPQGLGSVGIQYKQYGVSVGFTPTVLSSGMISMKVSPEVSELSSAGAYAFAGGGGTVPALITRRADTTVQLASGQSFAIGGLIQNDAQNNVSKIPWLGDLPILGALFRSTQFQRNETELVIVVTAYVVHPTDTVPALPTDTVRQTTDLERLLLDRVAARALPRFDPERAPHLRGAAGFLFE
jgi:pilus assembly protein CpaC